MGHVAMNLLAYRRIFWPEESVGRNSLPAPRAKLRFRTEKLALVLALADSVPSMSANSVDTGLEGDPYSGLGGRIGLDSCIESATSKLRRELAETQGSGSCFHHGDVCRILIADDHPLFREGVRAWIERQSNLTVCGQADTNSDVLRTVRQDAFQLVVLSLRLHGEDTLDLIKALHREQPGVILLAVAQSSDALLGEAALKAGARGLIMKDQDANDFLVAINTVLQGDIYLNSKLTSMILKKAYFGSREDEVSKKLSHRELQVFTLLGLGSSTREIAVKLNLSRRTVNVHRENIKRKLGIKAAPNLVYAAITWMQSRSSAVVGTSPEPFPVAA